VKKFLRPQVLIPAGVVVVIVLALGMYLFQPWKLFTTTEVNEALPTSGQDLDASAARSASPSASSEDAEQSSEPEPTPEPKPEPVVLAAGEFISHEHGTSGEAVILELPDGTRVLRIQDLDTSDGPDLQVWLTDAPVIDGIDGWGVFDDGRYVNLGALKGNVGNQNYKIPADVDLANYSSISIWCARFAVSFGAAELVQV
jgi:hypothetical protein